LFRKLKLPGGRRIALALRVILERALLDLEAELRRHFTVPKLELGNEEKRGTEAIELPPAR
jgi:hypothetical protein